jgi:hypothetical protein
MPKLKALPHEGVYTQILASKANAGHAGVFAIVPIRKGFNPFPTETQTLHWVSEEELKAQKLSRPIYKLYKRLGVKEGDKRYTYSDFGRLEQSAFVADGGKDSNLRALEDGSFRTIRRIKAGEELTVNFDAEPLIDS